VLIYFPQISRNQLKKNSTHPVQAHYPSERSETRCSSRHITIVRYNLDILQIAFVSRRVIALTLKNLFIKWLLVTQPITGSHALTLHCLRIMLLLTGKTNRVNKLSSLSKGKTSNKCIINMDKTTPLHIPSNIRKHYYLSIPQNEVIHM